MSASLFCRLSRRSSPPLRSMTSQRPFLDTAVITSRVIALFHSLPVAIAPEDVRGVGVHVTKLKPCDYETKEENTTRPLFSHQPPVREKNCNQGNRNSSLSMNCKSASLTRGRGEYAVPSLSQIDGEVLTQLPNDVKEEIRSSLRIRSLQTEGANERKRVLVTRFEPDARQLKPRVPLGHCRQERPTELGRSPFSLTQQVHRSLSSLLTSSHQTDFLVNMPSELVEEVWEEMCAKYRSKFSDCPLRPNFQTPPLSHNNKKLKKEEEAKEELVGVPERWELQSYHTQDLEELLSAWSWEENEVAQIDSLKTHAHMLVSKDQLDKVKSL
jgi:hypothetical protein